MGRFINADGLIGQAGDLIGHNLYAYCINNPIGNIDPSGYRWVSNNFNELHSKNEIHIEVHKKIKEKYPYLLLEKMFMDLFTIDPTTKKAYVWDVKPISYRDNFQKKLSASLQLYKYILKYEGDIELGPNLGYGSFWHRAKNGYLYFVQWYSETGDGLIYYSFERYEKDIFDEIYEFAEAAAPSVGLILLVAVGGYALSGCGAGRKTVAAV